ncbi:hypothetical protein [Helicobacter mehlei]|nr:hypothetical protein [Helicobacter mehlei]
MVLRAFKLKALERDLRKAIGEENFSYASALFDKIKQMQVAQEG